MTKKFQATDNIAFIYGNDKIAIKYENGYEPVFTDSISYLDILQLKADIDEWLAQYWKEEKNAK